MNNKLFFGLVVLAAGALVGWYVFGGSGGSMGDLTGTLTEESPTPTRRAGLPSEASEEEFVGQGQEKGGVSSRTLVTYTDTGFAPIAVTVKQGSTVTFVNESSRGMWVASGVYPSNQLLPSFNQKGTVAKGGVYEYTFSKAGTWQYQNDKNPSDIGYVTVKL